MPKIDPKEFAKLLKESLISRDLKMEIIRNLRFLRVRDVMSLYNMLRAEKLKSDIVLSKTERKSKKLMRDFRKEAVFFQNTENKNQKVKQI